MSDSTAVVKLQLQNQAGPEVRRVAGDVRALTAEEAKLIVAQERAAQSALKTATAEQRLATEAQRTAAAEARAETAALRLSQAQQRAASGAHTHGGAALGLTTHVTNMAKSMLLANVAMGAINFVPQLLTAGADAAKTALALRETQNSLRAVAGSAGTYKQVLATAREQQVLFGGSLQENIEGLSGLVIAARQSGAQLNTLVDLSKRLAVLDPAQGTAGARIALQEALSGDPISLARRYEIPRAALAKLRDTSTPVAERLKIIDEYLNKVGITSAAVAGKVDADAMAFRRLWATLEDVRIKAGDTIASGLAPLADAAAHLITGDSTNKLRDWGTLLSGAGDIGANAGAKTRAAAQEATGAILDLSNATIQAAKDSITAANASLAFGAAMDDERQRAAALGRELRANLGIGSAPRLLERGRDRSLTDTAQQRNRVLGAAAAIGGGATIVRHVLEQEQQRAHLATRHTAELGKQLNLEERIRDSKEAQYKAALDAAELTIKDRQQRRIEEQEIRTAQRILSSPRANAEMKAAAADKLALINIERQQRALAISEKGATAGGSIVNGRVLQSRPGGSAPPPTLPGAPNLPAGGGGGGMVVQFVVDGKVISQAILPYIAQELTVAQRRARTAGGGVP